MAWKRPQNILDMNDRIEALRVLMLSKGWDAVIVPGTDPHGSEYPALCWRQVEWLTGFTGEAADVVVTADDAGLWTDSRYFIQAREQLAGTGVSLHKTRVPEEIPIPEWLDRTLPEDAIVAYDSLCFGASSIGPLPERLSVVAVKDLLGAIWPDRPPIPQTPVFEVETGESSEEKIAWLRARLEDNGCDGCLVTALDEIDWLLNVRASDVEYNPYVISYLLVSTDRVKWFVLKDSVEDPQSGETFARLENQGVEILPYASVDEEVESFDGELYSGPDLIAPRKAVKNDFEIRSLREAHIREGVVMEKFLYWLEKSLDAGHRITEWDASVYLGKLRAEIGDYLGDSFETISAYGPGAALPHYRTPATNAPVIGETGLYLCDSGGQYMSGTTDITRTVPVGECTPQEREDYTLVLKSHIDLAMAVFPKGTPGCRIDALGREPLWKAHRNFGHGTGHGVGFLLGVHEGPQDIRQNLNPAPLEAGMVVSDEPGIYREGLFGVRHENLLLCVDDGQSEFGEWLRFEPLTLCHFDTAPVDFRLLERAEIKWLNAYNEKVFTTLAPLLPPEIASWLRGKTLSSAIV